MANEITEISEVKAPGSTPRIPLKLEIHRPDLLSKCRPFQLQVLCHLEHIRLSWFLRGANINLLFAVFTPDIVICPTTASDFDFTFDCGWIDIKGNVNWYSKTPDQCPHVSPITLNGKLPSVGSSHCYIVRPVGVMLDSTNITNYYLVTNFTDIYTGKILDNPAYTAYAFFFDPSSNILLNNDTEMASDANPFLQELIRPVLISPLKRFLFRFSQTEWNYLKNERSWLGKSGFPFVPRKNVTTLNFVIQETSYNATNYDALSAISISADYTKQTNRLVHHNCAKRRVVYRRAIFFGSWSLSTSLWGETGLAHVIRFGPSPFETNPENPIEEIDGNHATGGGDDSDDVRRRLYGLESQMVIVRNHFLNMDNLLPGTIGVAVRSGTVAGPGRSGTVADPVPSETVAGPKI
ncbi:hypothetical protein BC938DRAFT_482928 [Jimgerdemannia flammicorona]|uniref:Uncharacterized protein n=1 Tax=Jimgerdemannia flammicorona TaxID=994334 RepID=A0A433QD27_9FUNG|nr:hypothetical protein BC938DRAFT_482928 [Jimgerdemannia flammicorona]